MLEDLRVKQHPELVRIVGAIDPAISNTLDDPCLTDAVTRHAIKDLLLVDPIRAASRREPLVVSM